MKYSLISASALILMTFVNSSAHAQELSFPWGGSRHAQPVQAVSPSARYLTLSPLSSGNSVVSTDQMPLKSGYAYGWFGTNPSAHWSRHFGNSRGYTQWTKR